MKQVIQAAPSKNKYIYVSLKRYTVADWVTNETNLLGEIWSFCVCSLFILCEIQSFRLFFISCDSYSSIFIFATCNILTASLSFVQFILL